MDTELITKNTVNADDFNQIMKYYETEMEYRNGELYNNGNDIWHMLEVNECCYEKEDFKEVLGDRGDGYYTFKIGPTVDTKGIELI